MVIGAVKHINSMKGLVIMSLMACVSANFAAGAEYFVSPAGDDKNPGTREKPLASPEGARDIIRKSGRAGKEPITVSFSPGTYYLDKTLVFSPEDSGRDKSPVVYKSLEEGKAIISGGRKLDLKWEPYKDGIMKAKTPPGISFDQLFADGLRQNMARYPNYDPNTPIYNGYAPDAFSKERAARWSNPAGGYIHAMHSHMWGGYHYLITGKDDKGDVTYTGGWQNNRQMGMHEKYRFVENIFEELDAPGEWFHDKDAGILYYYPLKDTDITKCKIEIVQLPKLVDFVGSKDKPVRFINMEGFTFEHAARTFMDNKEPLLRSDWTIYRGGAVTFTGASDCMVSDCVFDQPGGNAVFVNKWNRRITIKGCLFTEVGASGVAFVGDPATVRSPLFEYNQRQNYKDIDKTPGPKSDDYPSECIVDDCLMARTGRIEKQGAGVHISMSSKITVRHCSIYDTSRSGININEGTFGGHIIEFCDVFDTVKETGDHGSFNSWGRDRYWGLNGAPEKELPELVKLDMVSPNIIRNSRWRCDHGWDIDLDDGSSCYEIYNNLLLNGGLKLREGFSRNAYNNIILNSSLHPHVWFKDSGDVFRNNIVMGAYWPALMNDKMKWGKEVDYNIFTTNETDRKKFATQGCDENSIVAEVKFVDPQNGDFRVKDECKEVFDIGFKNFPMDQFGVMKKSLKAIARTPKFPVIQAKTSGESTQEESRQIARAENIWQQAKVRTIGGEEFSAYGVAKEDGGISLVDVPMNSIASSIGLKSGDLIQKINGEKVRDVKALLLKTTAAGGKPMSLGIIRGQKSQALNAERYVYSVAESSVTPDGFKSITLKKQDECAAFRALLTSETTKNDPVSILSDGKISEGYGPVFANGSTNGIYKVDLEEAKEIKSVTAWSFNQDARRARQAFVLYGSSAPTDPGWDPKGYLAIAEVSASSSGNDKYLATRILDSKGASLGKFRWLVLRTFPISDFVENTSFQEFQVETMK